MQLKSVVSALVLAASFALAAPASAQFANPEAAIKYRQSALTVMGANVGRLGAMVQGRVPFDAARAQAAAKIAAAVAHVPWEGFIANSYSGNTKAKADIAANMAEFNQMADKAAAEVDKLPAAAGNLDSLKAQMGAVGAACKSCHDKYRNQ